MLARCLSSLIALLLSVTPAASQALGGDFILDGGTGQRPQNETVTLTRGTCVHDTANATTYNSAGFQATGTGRGATETYYPIVTVSGEDNAAAFGVASMTINGSPAIEVIDEDGSGVVNTALYRGATEITGSTINVSVTFTEALAGSASVCAWGLKGLQSFTPSSSVQDDDTASGVLVLTTGTTVSGGFVVGLCAVQDTGVSTTWAVLTEQEDAANGEHDVSNADAAATGASMANTCDWSGAGDASGVAAAFR